MCSSDLVARGTDYRYGGFDVPKPMEDEAYIELVREKMAEWNCRSLLLATEDADASPSKNAPATPTAAFPCFSASSLL